MKTKHLKISILSVASALAFTACRNEGVTPISNSDANRFFVMEVAISEAGGTAGVNNLLVVSDVESGNANIKNSVEAPPETFIRANFLNPPDALLLQGGKTFYKYKLNANNQLEEVAKVPAIGGRPTAWIDNKRFFATGDDRRYGIYNFETMSLEKEGSFESPVSENRDYWVGISFYHNDKIYLGFADVNKETYADTLIGFQVLNPTSLEIEKTLRDYRTVGAGQPNTNEAFTENGYTYFMAMPSPWWYNRPLKPSAILRINPAGDIDPDFMFNISEKLGGLLDNGLGYKYHTDGIFHSIGGGKFLVRVTREDKITDYKDYYDPSNGVYAKEHYVADINAGTVVKLNVPDCFAAYENMIEYDDKIVFPVNTANGAYIYVYNKSTGEVKQGIKVDGAKTINTIKIITK